MAVQNPPGGLNGSIDFENRMQLLRQLGLNPPSAQGGMARAMSGNPLDPNYASIGTPEERYARAIRQQAAIRESIFQPQYEKAVKFALDKKAPQREAASAAAMARRFNAQSAAQQARMAERSQSAVDPLVQAENARLQTFGDARNISNAYATAYDETRALQADQLSEVTGLGINTARQALGLQAGAASSYADRQKQGTQAEMMKQQAQQAAQAANMQMATAITTSIISAAVTAALA